MHRILAGLLLMITPGLTNTVPENLVVDGIPAIPAALQADAGRYLDFRSAAFQGWHPQRREMIILTRFADTPQLHWVAAPGGARRQLTFLAEPVKGGGFRPKTGECIVFSQDVGGTEMFQLHRYDLATGHCLWNKKYVKRHEVGYDGYNEGKGIFGKWEIIDTTPFHGGFLIWPKGMGDPTNHRKREEVEAPAETDHRAISESELVTVSAENLDQAEEKFDD